MKAKGRGRETLLPLAGQLGKQSPVAEGLQGLVDGVEPVAGPPAQGQGLFGPDQLEGEGETEGTSVEGAGDVARGDGFIDEDGIDLPRRQGREGLVETIEGPAERKLEVDDIAILRRSGLNGDDPAPERLGPCGAVVACGDDEGAGRDLVGIAEGDVTGSLRRAAQAGGDEIDLAPLQSRDEGVEGHLHPLHGPPQPLGQGGDEVDVETDERSRDVSELVGRVGAFRPHANNDPLGGGHGAGQKEGRQKEENSHRPTSLP